MSASSHRISNCAKYGRTLRHYVFSMLALPRHISLPSARASRKLRTLAAHLMEQSRI